MRGILGALLLSLCLATAACAAASAETSPTPEVNWAIVIASLVAATSIGTRLIAFIVKYRRLILILVQVIERWCNIEPDSAVSLKDLVQQDTEKEKPEVQELLLKAAAAAEKKLGKDGKSTKKLEASKRSRFFRGLARWAPIVGAFL